MAAPIEFYFDFASPYGYFASLSVEYLAERHGRAVDWRPFLLGAVFKVTGSRPNMEAPLRGEYLAHDAGRIARLLQCPFRLPDVMPANSLAASRAYWFLAESRPDEAVRFAKAILRAHWGDGLDIGREDVVAEVASRLGLDAAAAVAGAREPAAKDRLRAVTDRAIALRIALLLHRRRAVLGLGPAADDGGMVEARRLVIGRRRAAERFR